MQINFHAVHIWEGKAVEAIRNRLYIELKCKLKKYSLNPIHAGFFFFFLASLYRGGGLFGLTRQELSCTDQKGNKFGTLFVVVKMRVN